MSVFSRLLAYFGRPLRLSNSLVSVDVGRAARAQDNQGLDTGEGSKQETLYARIHRLCHEDGKYPHGWIVRAKCPCCDNPRLKPAFEKFEMRHDRCTECDYICVNPYPPEDFLGSLYAGSIYTQIREYYELPRARDSGQGSAYSAPLDLLDLLIARGTADRKSGAWLDVGGGIGVFADLVAQRAPGWNVSLNEMNPRSIEIARELFRLTVITGDAEKLLSQRERFDVISMIAVLEHVVDPLKFVEEYTALLKPGGLLLVIVPHFTALNVHVSKASSGNVIPPFHLSLFGESNLKRLFDRTQLFSCLETLQAGEPSFSLIDHIEHWKYWDSLLPDKLEGSFRSIRVADYPANMNAVINKLDTVVGDASDYFAEHDGRVHLALIATRKV